MVHAREKGEDARRLKEIVEIESIDPQTGRARTNDVYRWSPNEDNFAFKGTSWLLQQISTMKGVDLNILNTELQRRKKLLEWMQERKITKFKDVAAIFSEYNKDPEKTLKEAGIL
jgi:flagellar protein FlaI